ncbi:MAG: hypothetical protein ACI93R_000427 [Flavobacteriales bacterium]|jgi:hypothetical protein
MNPNRRRSNSLPIKNSRSRLGKRKRDIAVKREAVNRDIGRARSRSLDSIDSQSLNTLSTVNAARANTGVQSAKPSTGLDHRRQAAESRVQLAQSATALGKRSSSEVVRDLSSRSASPLTVEANKALLQAKDEVILTRRNGALLVALDMASRLERQGLIEEAERVLKQVQKINDKESSDSISLKIVNLNQAIREHGRLLGGDGFSEFEEVLEIAVRRGELGIIPNIIREAKKYYNRLERGSPERDAVRRRGIILLRHAINSITPLYRRAANDLDIERFRALKKILIDISSSNLERLKSDGFSNLIDAEDINGADGNRGGRFNDRRRFPRDGARSTYIFPAIRYSALSTDDKLRVAQATEYIQEAVTQAHNELISGNLVHFEGSGHLDQWKRQYTQERAEPLTSAMVGSLIEYRTMALIQGEIFARDFFGMRFDDQVPVRRIAGLRDAIPDIVLTTRAGETLYIDITANSDESVGHVLTKGGGVLQRGAYLSETTYPQVDVRNITYDPNHPPNAKLTPAQIAAIRTRFDNITRLRDGLDLSRATIRRRLRNIGSDLGLLRGRLIDGSFTQTRNDAADVDEMLARLSGYAPVSFISGQQGRVSMSDKKINQSVRDLNDALNHWWNFDSAASSKTLRIRALKTALEEYVSDLDTINELRRG